MPRIRRQCMLPSCRSNSPHSAGLSGLPRAPASGASTLDRCDLGMSNPKRMCCYKHAGNRPA